MTTDKKEKPKKEKIVALKDLRRCFGAFMTGVTVVTSKDVDGNPIGFTANSFTSVSLDPPLLLVCIDNKSENINAYLKGAGFAVNILASDQQDLSAFFSSPVQNRFANIPWQSNSSGNPILDDCAAYFDCGLENTITAGDHTILIGHINACSSSGKHGLGYANGGYFTLPVGDAT